MRIPAPMSWTTALSLSVAFGLLLAGTGTLKASDYVHQCRSADGAYAMNDGELRLVSNVSGRETGRAISYTVLRKQELRKSKGYCISYDAPRGRRRFAFEGVSYALRIRFRHAGNTQKAFMICEMASSGLPAAYNCDREVKILDWELGRRAADRPRPGHHWSYKGSGIRIVAKGKRRRLIYMSPSDTHVDRGVRAGDPLFVGRREGNRYIGTAYAYSKRCRVVSFKVSGRVEEGERRVVVSGQRPVLGRDCRTIYRQPTRLVFERS